MFEPLISQRNFEKHCVWLLRTMSANGMAPIGTLTSKYGIQRISMPFNFWDVEHIYDFFTFSSESTCFATRAFISDITSANILIWLVYTCGTIHARITCTFINIWKIEAEHFLFHSGIWCQLLLRIENVFKLVISYRNFENHCVWLPSMYVNGMARTGTLASKFRRVSMHFSFKMSVIFIQIFLWKYLFHNECLHIRYH